jgi:hypothetical protein
MDPPPKAPCSKSMSPSFPPTSAPQDRWQQTPPNRIPQAILERITHEENQEHLLYYSAQQDAQQERLKPKMSKGMKAIFELSDKKGWAVATTAIPTGNPEDPMAQRLTHLKVQSLETNWPDAILVGKGTFHHTRSILLPEAPQKENLILKFLPTI